MRYLNNSIALVIAGACIYTTAAAFDRQEPATPQGQDAILLMWEEEKLAHDIYTVLWKKWGGRPFTNIARAETQHMTLVEALMSRKGIKIPPLGKPGKFKNKELQALYIDIERRGQASFVEALKVGATVEDRDIYDLDMILKVTKDEDATSVYQALRSGSTNHMRAFIRNLTRRNETYKPQYISQDTFDVILAAK